MNHQADRSNVVGVGSVVLDTACDGRLTTSIMSDCGEQAATQAAKAVPHREWNSRPKFSSDDFETSLANLLHTISIIINGAIVNKQQHTAVKSQIIDAFGRAYQARREQAMPDNLSEGGSYHFDANWIR